MSAALSLGRYLAVAAFFALGLMAKPMLVTLPVGAAAAWTIGRWSEPASPLSWPRLLLEKLPLLALMAASSVVTLVAQHDALKTTDVCLAARAGRQRPGRLRGLPATDGLPRGPGGALSASPRRPAALGSGRGGGPLGGDHRRGPGPPQATTPTCWSAGFGFWGCLCR